ncbi:MAG: CpaE family protein [Phenylobacterium sp.]|uniref:AAA family ATPase n=1 Tax=Phenylobacterium sp. TaxID=1871053 RepID=UPI003918781A
MIFARRKSEPILEPPAPVAREAVVRVAYDVAAFDGAPPPASLAAQFPQIAFDPLSGGLAGLAVTRADAFILALDAAAPGAADRLVAVLQEPNPPRRVIVFLSSPDVAVSRRLLRAGAADVLAAPLSETALAVSLERLLATLAAVPQRPPEAGAGAVVAVMKAGGGVGASALTAQLAALTAAEGASRVCVVDLDVQFGAQALYLDVDSTVTLTDVLAATGDPAESGLARLMAASADGVRVLGAPRELMPLEAVRPQTIEALLRALRRDFDLVLIDMPGAWTSWTREALAQAGQILLVTELSVAHAHLVRRQLQELADQGLSHIPLRLICNRCVAEAAAGVGFRAVEAAIGRGFDVKIAEDRKLMGSAVNQGLSVRALRRGSQLERSLRELATLIAPQAAARARSAP